MISRLAQLALVTACTVTGCSPSAPASVSPSGSPRSPYAGVVSAIAREVDHVIVLDDSTHILIDAALEWLDRPGWEEPRFDPFRAAIADFRANGKSRAAIPFPLLSGLGVAAQSEVKGMGSLSFESDTTLVFLSRVSFNTDSTAAITEVDTHCGPTCGSGSLLLFKRDGQGGWRVWARQLLYIY